MGVAVAEGIREAVGEAETNDVGVKEAVARGNPIKACVGSAVAVPVTVGVTVAEGLRPVTGDGGAEDSEAPDVADESPGPAGGWEGGTLVAAGVRTRVGTVCSAGDRLDSAHERPTPASPHNTRNPPIKKSFTRPLCLK